MDSARDQDHDRPHRGDSRPGAAMPGGEQPTVLWSEAPSSDAPPGPAAGLRSSHPHHDAQATRTHLGYASSDVRVASPSDTGDWLGVGSQVGGYRLLRRLGQGGMGEVYEAEEATSARHFALKLLSPRLPRTPETVERFLNEASLAASLSHPQTTFVYGAGQDREHFYIVMELMPGGTLKDRVEADGPLALGEAVDCTLEILDGLEAAHARGVIHRDVKPSNCFVDEQGHVKVGDFGLAKSLIAGADITQTGAFLGTPQFAAPEQIRRGAIDARTDLFSVGATLFYLLTGRAPYEGDPASVIAQIAADPAPSVRQFRPDLPPALDRIVRRSLSKKPGQRFRSATHFRSVLEPYASSGVPMADVGRRLAAFFLDLVVMILVALVGRLAGIAVLVGMLLLDSPFVIEPALPFFAEVSLLFVAYFAITEGLWGRSPAKHWLGMRVVSSYGDPPGLWRALLRAAIFPGLFLTSIDVGHALLADTPSYIRWIETLAPNEILRRIVVPDILLLTKVTLCLICCSSMRRGNGYRGWHEFLSGTRVVRMAAATQASAHIPTRSERLGPAPASIPPQLGTYRVIGALDSDADLTILQGRDDSLTRTVWLVCAPASRPFPERRFAVHRRTRQRVLQSGQLDGVNWLALESMDGAPLSHAFDSEGRFPWRLARHVLPALADELAAAIEDQTLPNPVALSHLWLDRQGQLRLLDFQCGHPTPPPACGSQPITPPTGHASDRRRAARLLAEVARHAARDPAVPGAAVDFMLTLPPCEPDRQAFAALSKRFREFADIPYQLTWDGRLGMLAVSAGVEMVLISTWCLLIAWLALRIAPAHLFAAVALAIPGGLALPIALAALLRGGLAFRLCGFETRARSTRQRSAARTLTRSLFAWLPIIVPETIQKIATVAVAGLRSAEQLSADAALTRFGPAIPLLLIPAVLFTLLAVVGVVASLVSPRRGIQDRLSGTYIVHR